MHRWSADRHPILRETLERFEKAHPGVKVADYEVGSKLDEKLLTEWLAGMGPDVAMISLSSSMKFGERGFLSPLTPFAAKDKTSIKSMIYPGVADAIAVKGETWYLPMTMNVGRHLMYYNTAHFEQAGLNSTKPPTSHTAWLEVAKKLSRVNGDGTLAQRGIDLVTTDNSRNNRVFETLTEQWGSGIFNSAGTKVLYDLPRAISVANWMVDFNRRLDGFLASAADEGRERFQNRQSSMYMGIDGDWFIFTSETPDLELAMAPLPTPDGQPLHSVAVPGWGWGVPSNTKHPELAWELVKWLSVERNGGAWFIQQQGRMSSNPVMNRDPKYFEVHKYWNVLMTVANAGLPAPVQCSNVTSGEVYGSIGDAITQAAKGTGSPESLLPDLQRVLQAKCNG
jgi:ABC-type glycerol-3-phosphate transport system substrate-binding protein